MRLFRLEATDNLAWSRPARDTDPRTHLPAYPSWGGLFDGDSCNDRNRGRCKARNACGSLEANRIGILGYRIHRSELGIIA